MFAEQPQRMTAEAFLAWEADQEEKHELVDGLPMLRRARLMAGGTRRHARVASRVVAALSRRLAGGPCEPVGSDLKLRSPTGNFRYPDVMVECGPAEPSDPVASEPRIIIEVLSPSNTSRGQMRLLADYQAIPTVAHLVFLEQDTPAALVWTRVEGGWRTDEFTGWEAVAELPGIGASLPLAEIYEGLVPREDAG